MKREEMIDLIRRAASYRSGADSCNSLYMGSMATHSLYCALGGTSPLHDTLDDLLSRATTAQLGAAMKVCDNIIRHMTKHPTKPCPCCGQIVPATKRSRGYTLAMLEEARRIATEVCEDYGEFDNAALARFRKNGIWNDHPAVQAALRAMGMTEFRMEQQTD
jgi:hypothetical protein